MSSEKNLENETLLNLYESDLKKHTDESYFLLLEGMYSLSTSIPGVTIEISSTKHPRLTKLIESRNLHSEGNGIEVLGTEHVKKFFVRFMKPKKKIGDFNEIQVFREDMKLRFDKYGNDIEALGIRVNYVIAENGKKDMEEDTRESFLVIENIKDSFTFIMVDPLSLAGFIGLFVFLAQIASFSLVMSYLYVDNERTSDFYNSNPLSLPKGADIAVHSGQGIALPLILLVQQSFWEATSSLRYGFKISLNTQGIQYGWWVLSNSLRLFEALVATFVTFMLVLRSDNVVDLFKDFTAITFVSSFDNIVYILAKMNVIGKRLKKAVIKCESVEYKVDPYQHSSGVSSVCSARKGYIRRNFFHPAFVALGILSGMYITWIHLILIPHRAGSYLCQKLYMQLDDKVNPHLSYFSGSYKLLTGPEKKGIYHTYREVKTYSKKNDEESEMILRFCSKIGWVFILDINNEKHGCDEDYIVAKSGFMINQQKYDVFEVLQDDWFVMNKYDNRWMPLENFKIGCEDNGPKYSLQKISPCETLEIDAREKEFISTRVWSNKFTIVKQESRGILLINDHPVYSSMKRNYEVEQEIIIYVGKRWIITSTDDLEDYKKMKTNGSLIDLRLYLASHFHPYWSEYEVAFFSEPIEIDTLLDSMTPAGLSWVKSSPKIPRELQFADDKRDIPSVFLCSECNNSTNQCFYGGVCLSDQSCKCTSGSFGALCQIVPSGNGFCDVYFNSRKFEYDGGDCCKDTCTSSDKYDCGKDEKALIHVGYDNCETETCTDCWRESKFQSSLNELMVADISISENGQILALVESVGLSVRIYDNLGKNWIMRGAVVTNIENVASDKIQISAPNFVSDKRALSPVTIVTLINGSIKIFEWDVIQWKEQIFYNMPNTTIKQISLRHYGYRLGVLYKDNLQNKANFKLFNRPQNSLIWKEIYNPNGHFRSMSLSEDGNKVALASTKCIEFHHFNMMKMKNCTLFDKDIIKVQVSSGGQMLSVLVNRLGFKGEIYLYNTRNDTFEQSFEVLRGVPSSGISMDVSNDGKLVTMISRLERKLQFHAWKNNSWEKNQEANIVKGMSLSSRKTVLVVISERPNVGLESTDSLVVYHKNDHCNPGMSKLRFTFIPDYFPLELHYEIVNITMSNSKLTEEIEVLRKLGPHSKTGATIVEEMCISNKITTSQKDNTVGSGCIGIRVFDFGLEGLKYPGMIGVSIKGKVIFSVNSTDGYDQTFPILGGMDCMGVRNHGTIINDTKKNVSDKKYNIDLHKKCASEECSWTKTGQLYNSKSTEPNSCQSLSADGLVLAFGSSSVKNSTAKVSVFEYDGSHWMPRGLNLTGIDINGSFGQSVSLSADGLIVAVGAPNSFTSSIGQVFIYKYDQKKQTWDQYGSAITDNSMQESGLIYNTTVGFGSFVDISADGSIVAVGLTGTFNNPYCLAFVFKYNIATENWEEIGNCIPSTKGQHRSVVKLSSTGSIIAIGNAWHDNLYGEESILGYIQDPEYSRNIGRVSVYEYDNGSEKWMEKGQFIEGNKLFGLWGFSIDISSDGLILAIGGALDAPSKVYKYNFDQNSWEVMGQTLGAIKEDPNTFDDPNTFAVALSSSGSVLTLSHDCYTSVYLFDELWGIWSQGVTKVPMLNFTKKIPMITVSADATKMAIEGDDQVYLIQLKKIDNSRCKKEESLFNLTIQPDLFPKDISWTLQSKGLNVLGTRLTENQNQKTNTLVYTKCVQRSEIYTFVIEDDHGDGICCNWGDGNFILKWDDEIVMDSLNFTSIKTLCMPQSLELSFFSVDFGLAEEEMLDPSINWFLFDSKQNMLNVDRIPFQCIPSNECISFVIIDTYAADSSFTGAKVMVDDEVVLHLRKPGFSFYRTLLMCKEKSCPEGSTFFEMQLYTDATVSEFAWELRALYKNQTLASGDNYEEAFMYYYFSDCIPATLDDCLEIEINQPSYGRNNFQLSLDGEIIVNTANWNDLSSQKQLFGSCLTCEQKEVLFEMSFVTDEYFPNEFSWELADSNYSIIANGGLHEEKNTFFHYGKCIVQEENECFTLRLFDTGDKSNTFYVVRLDGHVIGEDKHSNAIVKILIGECSISCPMNHSFFQLDFLINNRADDISWELVDSNNNTLASRNNFSDANLHHYYGKCISVAHNQCATLRLFDKGLLNDDGQQVSVAGANYMVSWDGVLIDEDTLVTNSHETTLNCCPQNQTRFELSCVANSWSDEFSWSLLDWNDTVLAGKEMNSYGYTQQYYGECVAAAENECLRVQLINLGGDGGIEYVIKWDGDVIEDSKHDSDVSEIAIGECGVTGFECPNQQILFELDFVTDGFPCEFSWKLVSPYNVILASGEDYKGYEKKHELKKCVLASQNECLTLHLLDYYGDGGTKYSVKWDGNLIQDGEHISSSLEITMGNCDGAPELQCSDNQTRFDLFLTTDNNPSDFSWKLLGPQNEVFASGGHYIIAEQQHHHEQCISISENECLRFHLFDSHGDGGSNILIKWDGNVITSGFHQSAHSEFKINC